MVRRYEMELAGRPLVMEVGKVAKQASAAVWVQYGETVVLTAVTVSKEERELDFFPLTVNYEERLYAVGRIPGGFIKREGRPSERAVLSSRLIDRPIRPLFPDGFRHEVQVVNTVLSVDQDCSPDVAAMIGTSAALSISEIPFQGPIAGLIVGRVNGQFVINPTVEQEEQSDLHLVVAGTSQAIMMVEAGALEVPEEVVLQAILHGHREMQPVIRLIEQMVQEIGKPKMEWEAPRRDEALFARVDDFATERLLQAIQVAEKHQREEAIEKVADETLAHFTELLQEEPEALEQIPGMVQDIVKREVRKMILDEHKRPDGRALDEIRPLSCEVGVLPRTHGSGLFTRGQTQALSVCTLGALGDVQILDGLGLEDSKRFMHHYNFPPYSVGEARPIRAPGRREIGHGALGERALSAVIPDESEFPYTIRLVSEVLESNGSTSQASICASTLAMMDAGVPLKAPVAGIAMGLVKSGDKVAILTDIQGMEDHLGDMDFKVAGTAKGITALQMDIKIDGIDEEILRQALEQARVGRLFILDAMLATIPQPRKQLSKYAPKITTLQIHPDKIRDVIGPSGRVINSIINDTGVKIDIEQDGRIYITSTDEAQNLAAKKRIEELVRDVVVGEMYTGKVKRIEKFGAFVEILPGKEGLVHISQLSNKRVERVEDVVKMGDDILVKVTEIDSQGRINLSRKAVLQQEHTAAKKPLRQKSLM